MTREQKVVPSRPLDDPTVRSVAVVRLRVGLGDLLASVPALRALRTHRPDLHVAMITWDEVRPVVERMNRYVDELVAFPGHPGIPERPPRSGAIGSFFEEMRARGFDLAVQMYGGQPAANAVTKLLGARISGGFYTAGEVRADPRTHLPYPHDLPEVERHLSLMRFLGVSGGTTSLEFPLTPIDLRERDRLFRDEGLSPFAFVCLHPGATARSRRWPAERFGAVAERLVARGWPVVVIGAANERGIARKIACRSGVIDLCGRTTLGGVAAVIQSAAAVVGNDSGPAHLAAALGTRSVTIFLAGDPRRWAATDRTRHRPLYADVECRPCGLLECPIDFRCARGLDVEKVADEVLGLVEERQCREDDAGAVT